MKLKNKNKGQVYTIENHLTLKKTYTNMRKKTGTSPTGEVCLQTSVYQYFILNS
jgi:hypothetical protein